MIKAIIFDMDGTLVDSEPVFSSVWERVAGKRNRIYTTEMKKRIMGRPDILNDLQLVIDEWQVNDTPEAMLKELNDLYLEMLPETLRPMEGLHETLGLLHRMRLRQSISTSSPKVWADIVVRQMDLNRYMEHVITSDDMTIGKPHPEAFLLPVQRLGLQPDECLAVEDSVIGLRSAKAAGIQTIAIRSPFFSRKELPPHDFYIDSLHELNRLFFEQFKS